MNKRKSRIFSCDFETTVYEGQTSTEVWAAACVELGSSDVHVFHSIDEQFEYFVKLDDNLVCYYHNLKFDGSFWVDYLINVLHFKQAADFELDDYSDWKFKKDKEMPYRSFKYVISDTGQWYSLTINYRGKYIELRDSLKLLPFPLKQIGKDFKTIHQKLEMKYEGARYAGCEITDAEMSYIKNDVLVLKEALEIMYEEGHNRLTIGSCCLYEYRKLIGADTYKHLFPDLTGFDVDASYGAVNADEYVRRAYHGGWCYVAKGKERKLFNHGFTLDVNSLYPGAMHSASGNYYPVGEPYFFKGEIPDFLIDNKNYYYFVRFKCKFYLKANHLPFIQQKTTLLYNVTEMLETSDIKGIDGKYYSHYIDINGDEVDVKMTLTMTMIDFKLFLEHYNVVDLEILDGCYFKAEIGIFDEYINKYKKIKMESTGAQRTLAKLFLNNLYGKMAASSSSNFKVAFTEDDGTIGYFTVLANDKKPGYIACGAAITSYARNFTIRAAQANFYGKNKPGFIYADTDSIHCDLDLKDFKGIEVDDKEFYKWKIESTWDAGWFVRPKTYIEHVVEENLQKVENPFYNVKCAGLPDHCKDLFLASIGEEPKGLDADELTQDEIDYIVINRKLTDFDLGMRIPGKLVPKRIPGGTLLVRVTYEMR